MCNRLKPANSVSVSIFMSEAETKITLANLRTQRGDRVYIKRCVVIQANSYMSSGNNSDLLRNQKNMTVEQDSSC